MKMKRKRKKKRKIDTLLFKSSVKLPTASLKALSILHDQASESVGHSVL